jgi:hypothetical protein
VENGAVGVMVSTRGKMMVLGEELDLRGQGGTIRKLRVSSTRWDEKSLLVSVYFDMILLLCLTIIRTFAVFRFD